MHHMRHQSRIRSAKAFRRRLLNLLFCLGGFGRRRPRRSQISTRSLSTAIVIFPAYIALPREVYVS